MREAAADRSLVADLHVADMRRGFWQQRAPGAQHARSLNVRVRRHRAYCEAAAGLTDVTEVRDAPEIDHGFRLGEPQLHRGNQAVAAGEQLRVVTVLREKLDRLVDRRWTEVFELSGIHKLDLLAISYQLTADSRAES